ncbi:MAG: glycosyltransferase family 4 protein [Pseudomonadota bacterium]
MTNQKTPIKICYVATSAGDWGGASRSLFLLLKKIDRTKISPFVLFPGEGTLTAEMEKRDIPYRIWGQMREFHGIYQYAKDIVRAIRFFRAEKIEILHINHSGYWRPAEVLAAKILNIPVITHYRVIVDKPGPFVKYSTLVIANSEYTRDASVSNGVEKIAIHNIVDVERYDAAVSLREELDIDQNTLVVAFLGQIKKIKGIHLFIAMAKRIRREHVVFLIAGACRGEQSGGGSYTEAELTSEIGEDSRFIYLGHRTDVQNVYKTSDIIVMPSQWDEPFGLINVESGASKLPIVASRAGGIPEVIKHGENGFLVERDDLDELTQSVEMLLENKALREEIGKRARQIVEQRFVEAPVRVLEKTYQQIMDREFSAT